MKFTWLRYFTVLAEELHFGRAAAKLAITQPPLSTAIKSLEDELGVLLFERTKARVQLTPAGVAFLGEARQLLQGVARAKSVVSSIGKGIVGRLDIGYGPTLLFRDILEVVDEFNREAPGIEVVLHEMPSSEQFERLGRGQLNAGFAHGSVLPPKLTSVALKEDSFMLCVPAAHPRAGDPAISLSNLAEEDFVMFTREINPVNHDDVISLFSQAGIYPRFKYFTRGWMTMMAMVSEGRGIGVVPGSLGRMRMSGVRMIAISGPHIAARAMLVWNPGLVAPALEWFLQSAVRTIERQRADDREASPSPENGRAESAC